MENEIDQARAEIASLKDYIDRILGQPPHTNFIDEALSWKARAERAAALLDEIAILPKYRMDAWGYPATPCAAPEPDPDGEWVSADELNVILAKQEK